MSPSRASYGVFIVRIWEKIDRIMTTSPCSWYGLLETRGQEFIIDNFVLTEGKSAIPWWHHQMETFSALLALCVGNSLITGWFHSLRLVTRSFDIFFDLRLNKRLNEQSRRQWFETPSLPLWRLCNANVPPPSTRPSLRVVTKWMMTIFMNVSFLKQSFRCDVVYGH